MSLCTIWNGQSAFDSLHSTACCRRKWAGASQGGVTRPVELLKLSSTSLPRLRCVTVLPELRAGHPRSGERASRVIMWVEITMKLALVGID